MATEISKHEVTRAHVKMAQDIADKLQDNLDKAATTRGSQSFDSYVTAAREWYLLLGTIILPKQER